MTLRESALDMAKIESMIDILCKHNHDSEDDNQDYFFHDISLSIKNEFSILIILAS